MSSKRLIRYSIVSAVTGVTLLLSACSNSDDNSGGNANPNQSSDYLGVLSLIPDTPETRELVWVTNYRLAADLAELEIPGEEAGDDEVVAYLAGFDSSLIELGPGPYSSGFGDRGRTTNEQLWRMFMDGGEERGFDQRHVVAGAVAGGEPGLFEALSGEFSSSAFRTDTACTGKPCDDWQIPEQLTHGALDWQSWNVGYEFEPAQRYAPPVFDELGRGGNWLVQDDRLIRTIARNDMRDAIDAVTGERSSLADIEDFAVLVGAMEESRIYSALLMGGSIPRREEPLFFDGLVEVTHGYGIDPEYEQEFRSAARNIAALRPYRAMALGGGLDQAGPFVSALLVHSDHNAAEVNAERISQAVDDLWTLVSGQVWSEYYPQSVEVEVDGAVLEAKMRMGARLPGWEQMLATIGPILAHE